MAEEMINPFPPLTHEMLVELSEQEIIDNFNHLSEQVFKLTRQVNQVEAAMSIKPQHVLLMKQVLNEYMELKQALGLSEWDSLDQCLNVIGELKAYME